MTLNSILSQAASGIDSVTRRLAVVSQNVANANTPGYSREVLPVSSFVGDGVGYGVRSGVATRIVDDALQTDLFASGADVAAGQARQSALSAVDAASGAPGSGQDLASLLGSLRDAYSTLGNDPSSETQQRQVANQAAALARGINTLGNAISGQRQLAQDNLGDAVDQANAALRTVGALSKQIVAAQSRGLTTAELEDQRDAAIATVSGLTGAKFLPQSNGNVLAVSGTTPLPTNAESGPFSIDPASLTPGAAGPQLRLNGTPTSLAGGQISAQLELRDTTLPGLQAKLDGFVQGLAGGFQAAGLELFTDGSGTIPGTSAGFAQSVQVNPAVLATPSTVRDGSAAATTAGNAALINSVLASVLRTGPRSVASQATAIVAGHANLAANAAQRLETDQAVQSSLQTKLQATTGISIDSELADLVGLQRSYAANAKVISAVQTIWDQALEMVR